MIQPTNKHCSKKERPFFKAKFHRGELNPLFRSFQWIIWPSGQKACGMCSPFRTTAGMSSAGWHHWNIREQFLISKNSMPTSGRPWTDLPQLDSIFYANICFCKPDISCLPFPSPQKKPLLDLLVQSKWPEFHQLFLVPESASFFFMVPVESSTDHH